MTLLSRLESHNEFTESAEARQLRKDAAQEIRRLERELREALTKAQNLEALMLRKGSEKMRRVPA